MINILKTLIIVFAALTMTFLMTEPATASLIGGPDIIAAPGSVADDAPGAENEHQQAFDEKQGVVLSNDLQVDEGIISQGSKVSSHMIFFNTADSAGSLDLSVEWQFDGQILGVMSDGYGEYEEASNGVLGHPDTTYPGSFDLRGFEKSEEGYEAYDSYSVLGDKIIVSMKVSEPGDWIRVVTSSVPIPSAVWLLGSGLIGLMGLRRKFRK